MAECFASLTGDRNAMHLDEEVARKSRFRQPVVHGMLPFSFLVCLEDAFPESSVTFSAFTVRFLAPVFTGVALRLEVEATAVENGVSTLRARWTGETDGEHLIEATGTFRLTKREGEPTASGASRRSLLTEDVSECTYSIDEIEGQSESLAFSLDPGVLSLFQTSLFGPALGRDDYRFCGNLAACLLLSTLAGMRLPGRHGTFTSFSASFERTLSRATPCALVGTVVNVSTAGESISVSASYREAGEAAGAAQLKVLVNRPPRQMIDCDTIKLRYLDTGVRGKVAVITGSSRGIGETAAKLFAMHGALTVVHYYRGERDAAAIVDDIRSAGGTAIALGCDIRDEEQVTRLFEQVLDAYGRVDILVNNAVKEFRPKPFVRLRWQDFIDEFEVSVKGMHNCCREVVPILQRQRAGKIVNVSSVTVNNPVTGQNKYITAKSAVVGYTRSLAKELARDNIQVNVVVPGMTDTDLLSSIPGEIMRRMAEERDYGRNLAPIEVAQAMLYLSSGWSDGITGQQVVLNLGEPPFA
jgi:3-oxoacyl-[acyl-carrier protein] reductase